MATGRAPAASAASTRSSPSATNRRRSRRTFLACNARASCSAGLRGEVASRSPRGGRDSLGGGGDALAGVAGAGAEGREGCGLMGGELGQDLPVELDLRQLETVDELTVGEP